MISVGTGKKDTLSDVALHYTPRVIFLYTFSILLLLFLGAATSSSSSTARRPLQRLDLLPSSIALILSPFIREVIDSIRRHFKIGILVVVVVIEVVD
jgi:hypothetical protein